jgi:hypothetical protein
VQNLTVHRVGHRLIRAGDHGLCDVGRGKAALARI